jgi:NAD(P)-dependent dehydrogenase (short-subunit alcohol dehydrogenase family)
VLLKGKVAVVTGGGSGIGQASVRALGREGSTVAISWLRPAPLIFLVVQAKTSADGDDDSVVVERVVRFGNA